MCVCGVCVRERVCVVFIVVGLSIMVWGPLPTCMAPKGPRRTVSAPAVSPLGGSVIACVSVWMQITPGRRSLRTRPREGCSRSLLMVRRAPSATWGLPSPSYPARPGPSPCVCAVPSVTGCRCSHAGHREKSARLAELQADSGGGGGGGGLSRTRSPTFAAIEFNIDSST